MSAPTWAAPACLTGGDDTTINAALNAEDAKVELCPGAVFRLQQPIILSQDGQELGTAKAKKGKKGQQGNTPALLLVTGADQSTAVQSRASRIRLHDVEIDGQRPALGRLPKGGALIELGGKGVHDVRVDHIHAHDPRGWSVLHAFEGDKTCSGVVIEDNHIGPSGKPDGDWADGISLACRNSTVRRNLVEDASDGAIVIFGAPGSLIEDNQIITHHNVLLGGINLVDYAPYNGDYTGTVVRHNHIIGEGGFIKIGIAIGPSVWGADNQRFIHGATVTGNEISGTHVGYGIAADGAKDVDISGNRVRADFNGRIGARCYKEINFPQANQLVNPERVSGNWDKSMASLIVRYAICIEPAL